MRTNVLIFAVLISTGLVLLALPAFGTVYIVAPDGSGDFPTIQDAIGFCTDGDVVELASGTFTGDGNRDVDFLGKAITVRSQNGDPALCVIDCEGSPAAPHRGFTFQSGESPASVLEGVTIIHGYGYLGLSIPGGGGVLCAASSSPTFINCIFADNHAGMTFDHAGGGMYIDYYCDPSLQNCEFRANSAYFGGGLAVNHYSHATLENCLFIANDAVRGGGVWGNSTAKLHCVFFGNTADFGGAVWNNGYNLDYSESCTYTHNSAAISGGGFQVEVGFGSPTQLVDSIIAFSPQGAAFGTNGVVAIFLSCSDLYGNAGGDWIGSIAGQVDLDGNFSANPCFCDVVAEDFRLCSDSWCLPGHHPWGCNQLVGAFDAGCGDCDCGGPVPTVPRSWGSLKALYH